MKSPVLLLRSLIDDVKRLAPEVKGLDRDIITIESRFKHEGYGFLSVTLSSLCDSFDLGVSSGCFTCPSSFKTKGALPRFLSGLLCKVFDPRTGLLLDTPHTEYVKIVREILRLFKKVKLSPKNEEKLHSQAVLKFQETDLLARDFVLDQSRSAFLKAAGKIVLPNLDLFDSRKLSYKHGPGGVEEKLRANQKWSVLEDIISRDDNLRIAIGYGSLFSHDDPPACETEFPSLASCDVARLVTVPKDSTSRRTITVEPVVKQFLQQGLNTLLRSEIRSCRILSRCLALNTQVPNQELARIGSIDDSFATIDLSSASDLLSLKVVELVFASKPEFLAWAKISRTGKCRISSDTILALSKFAGMGNALTFPIQSVTFALLAICAIICADNKKLSIRTMMQAARVVRVFGDDIIIPTNYALQVVDWLTSFGLKVNQKKSFLKGNFKESCGLDAYMGVDVTPTYLRVEPVVKQRNPDQLTSLVSTSNQLWMKGLYNAATLLQKEVEKVIPLPLLSVRSAGLGLHSRVDTTATHAWCRKLQRPIAWAYVPSSVKQEDDIDGYGALMKCLSLPKDNSNPIDVLEIDKHHLQRSSRRFQLRIKRKRVPAHVGG